MTKWYLVYGEFAWGGGETLEEAERHWKKSKPRSIINEKQSFVEVFLKKDSDGTQQETDSRPRLDETGNICWGPEWTRVRLGKKTKVSAYSRSVACVRELLVKMLSEASTAEQKIAIISNLSPIERETLQQFLDTTKGI